MSYCFLWKMLSPVGKDQIQPHLKSGSGDELFRCVPNVYRAGDSIFPCFGVFSLEGFSLEFRLVL